MSDQILFDKLAYIDKLKSAGISDDQARAHGEALNAALRESVATKSDIAELRHELTLRVGAMLAGVVAILAAIKFFS